MLFSSIDLETPSINRSINSRTYSSTGVRVSMDGRGQALDNIRTERFFRTLKYDLIYVNEFETPRDLRKALNQYIQEYNTYRPHTSLDGLCPFQVYTGNAIDVA